MRQQLREMLGNLGSRIREVDDTYGNKVQQLIQGNSDEGPRRAIAEIVSAPLTYGMATSSHSIKDNPLKFLGDHAAALGIQGASAGVRYGLPAAGLTAAGAGLVDLTANFYESMSNTPVLES